MSGLRCNSSCNWYSSPKKGHILGKCNLAIKHGLADVYVDPESYCRPYKVHHEEEDRTFRPDADYTEHYESVADLCFGPRGTGGTPVQKVTGPEGQTADLLSGVKTCFDCDHYDDRGETGFCAYEIHPCPAVVSIQWSLSKVSKVLMPHADVNCACFAPKLKKCCGTCRWHKGHRCEYNIDAKIPSAYRMDDMVMYDTDGKDCPCYEVAQ